MYLASMSLSLKLWHYPLGLENHAEIFYALPDHSTSALKERVATALHVHPEALRLWRLDSASQWQPLDNSKTLRENGVENDLTIMAEHRHALGKEFLLKGPADDASLYGIVIDDLHCRHPSSIAKEDQLPIDFTSLINHSNYKFPLVVSHNLSGRSWSLPLEIPASFACPAEELKAVVSVSPLPDASIEALLRYLCFGLPKSDSPRHLCSLFYHVVVLFRQLGLETSRLLSDFETHAVKPLDQQTAIEALIDAATDKIVSAALTDPFIQLLVARVRLQPIGDAVTQTIFTRADNHRLHDLYKYLHGSFDLVPFAEDLRAPTWKIKLPTEQTSPSALPSTFSFILNSGDNVKEEIISDSLTLLLTQWPWVYNLMKSDMQDAKKLCAEMEPPMTRNALLAILHTLRGQKVLNLDPRDASVIMECAPLLNLCSVVDNVRQPLPLFAGLLQGAHDACFPQTDISNCLEQLVMASSFFGLEAKKSELLDFIAAALATDAIKATQLLMVLSEELLVLVKSRYLSASSVPA